MLSSGNIVDDVFVNRAFLQQTTNNTNTVENGNPNSYPVMI